MILRHLVHTYYIQQNVSDWESCDDVRYEPRPQVARPDPFEVQNSFLPQRTEQKNEQTDEEDLQLVSDV